MVVNLSLHFRVAVGFDFLTLVTVRGTRVDCDSL